MLEPPARPGDAEVLASVADDKQMDDEREQRLSGVRPPWDYYDYDAECFRVLGWS